MTKTVLKTRNGNKVAQDVIDAFAGQVRGALIQPGDDKYDEARKIWNALIDRHPGAILHCVGAADVIAAVNFARENDIVVAVRGGGHNVGGRALCDDGLVIDLSGMRGVHVDPETRRVCVQGGATLGDVDRETHLNGVAVPLGIVSQTGVGGLTTGGGFGWLARKYGTAGDNVIEADVVTADGRFRRASATENPDLFWAIRGGGGNFGVVTSFLYQAHPVSMVYGGLIAYPRDAASHVLRGYRDFLKTAPDELTVYAALLWGPDGTPLTALVPGWIGKDPAEGERLVAPLTELGGMLMADLHVMPFPALQSMLDGAYLPGSRNYWKSAYLTGLSDAAIDTIVDQSKGMTVPGSAMLLECFGGAVHRQPSDATAFAQRASDYLLAILPMWSDPADDAAQIAWARKAADAMKPFASGGAYLNYIPEGDDDVVRASFGANLPRLRELKAKYDPRNFFRLNPNIAPAA